MAYAYNQSMRVRFEVEGSGPTLLLPHGLWGSIYSWVGQGYTEALRDNFTLILMDARGHGDSDKP